MTSGSEQIFLVVETIDHFRWIGLVGESKEIGTLIARIGKEPVAGRLPPIPVEWLPETRRRKTCDFPIFRTTLKCPSRRARQALGDLMTPNGEWLDLVGLDEEYSAFHCLREVDCLDTDVLEAEERGNPLFSFGSARYVPTFRKVSLQAHHFFRIPQSTNKFFVSAEFARRYSESNLVGLDFLPVSFS